MSGTQKTERRWNWMRLVQFNLRTILIVVTVAAIACAVYLNSQEECVSLAGDALTVIQQTRTAGDDDTVYRSGRWIVQDKDERTRVIGYMSDDVPHGLWTAYYDNGQKAWQGRCVRGAAVGQWRVWDRNGVLRSHHTREWTGERAEVSQSVSVTSTGFGGGIADWQESIMTLEPSRRAGPFTMYWPSSSQKVSGQFENDLATGDWTFFANDGTVEARGKYLNGERQGAWQVRDESATTLREVYFRRGQRIDDVKAELDRLSKQLGSGSRSQQIAAASQLQKFGADATPILVELLDHTDEITVRILTLRTLSKIGAGAAEALPSIKPYLNSVDPSVEMHAHVACYCCYDGEVVTETLDEVWSAISAVKNSRVQCSTFKQLYETSNKHSAEILKAMLRVAAEADTDDRDRLARCIVELQPTPLTLLSEALQHEPPEIRLVICEIAMIYEYQHPPLYGNYNHADSKAARDLLRSAQDDADEKVRRYVRTHQ